MALKGDAEVAGGIDRSAGTADITDNVPDGLCRYLFEVMCFDVDKMARSQLSAIVTIDTDQTKTPHVKIMFAGKKTVELVRRLQCPRPMANRALRVHIDSSGTPGWGSQCAVATYVDAGRGCGVVRCRAGFGVVIGRNFNVDRLVEVFNRTDSCSFVAGRANPGDEVQGIMHPMVSGNIGKRAAGRRTSVTGCAILQGQGRTGQVAGRAGRPNRGDAVKIDSMAKSAGVGEILCIPMGNRAAPWCGIRRRSRRMRQIDIMAVLTAVEQCADLGVETWIAAGSARSRCMA